jgi:hypothetical protein
MNPRDRNAEEILARPVGMTLLVLVPTLLAGCVIFPHGQLVAPPAQGRVLDSETLEPLPHSKVVRRIERMDRTRVTFTDGHGDFAFKKDTHLRWLLVVDYAANEVQYRIEAAGYRPFETNLYGGGSFHPGTLPHDLGAVLLRRKPQPNTQGGPAMGNQPVPSTTHRPSSPAGSHR